MLALNILPCEILCNYFLIVFISIYWTGISMVFQWTSSAPAWSLTGRTETFMVVKTHGLSTTTGKYDSFTVVFESFSHDIFDDERRIPSSDTPSLFHLLMLYANFVFIDHLYTDSAIYSRNASNNYEWCVVLCIHLYELQNWLNQSNRIFLHLNSLYTTVRIKCW